MGNVGKNNHFIRRVKKVLDFYIEVANRHDINIEYKDKITALVESIHKLNKKYINSIMKLQNRTIIKVNEETNTINVDDLKYDDKYFTDINHYKDEVNNSRRHLLSQMKLLFSMEEVLFNLTKYKIVDNYA